jgi:isochorismate pyruvate lyase
MKTIKECKTIADVRGEIDRIDKLIIELLGERYLYIKEIVRFKTNSNEVEAPARYDEVLKLRRAWAAKEGINEDVVEKIYIDLLEYFIAEQKRILKLN